MQNDQIKLRKTEVQNQNHIKAGDIFNINTGKKDVNETVENGQYAFFSCSPYEYRSNEYLLDGEAILIAGNGSYTGTVRAYKGKFDLYQRTYALLLKEDKKNNWDINFLYFYFKWYFERKYMGGTHGGAIPYIVKGDIDSFEVPVLFKNEQTKVAEILSSLDDKIELNRKMNETLEKIGQALFKHWFVDFEFPDENGKLYKSSGGKMIDSELGEIPEEWEKGKIKNILKIVSGFAFSTKNYNREGKWGIVTIKNVQEGNFISECTDFILDLPIKMSADTILNKGDIVLSLTGNIGRACVVYGGKYLLNQRVAKIVSINKQNIAFCYFLLRQKNFQDLLISISKGVAQQNLSPVEMANLNIIIPGDNILKKFSLISGNMIEQIMKNLEENQILSQIRDSLLSRLMSGKLRVK